jgi:hypothetical protein
MSVIERIPGLRTHPMRWLGAVASALALMSALAWHTERPRPAQVATQAFSADGPREMPSNTVLAPAASTASHEFDPDSIRAELKPATRDPFSAQAAPLPPPSLPVLAAPVLAAPIIPREPPPILSFSGRMQTPDGRVVVLARWADGTPVSLEEGKDLGNGYRVERMSEQSVDLLNPQTQAMVQLALPPAPRFETR